MQNTLSVCIVDDEVDARRELRRHFADSEVDLIEFSSAEELLESDELDSVGCFLLNTELPAMSGLDLQVELRKRNPGTPTVITSRDAVVRGAIRAFHDGASAFFEKPYDFAMLVDTVGSLLAIEHEQRRVADDRKRRLSAFSKREFEVAQRLVVGKSIKTIARELGISPSTAEKHRTHILQKTRLDTVVELTRFMILNPASLASGSLYARHAQSQLSC